MGRVRYIPNQRAFDEYYHRQSGGNAAYFHGPSHQQGHGLGGLFGSLFRAAMPVFRNTVAPMLKSGAKAVAKEALRTGVGVASDMLSGQSGLESIEARLPMAGERLVKRGIRKLTNIVEPRRKPRRKNIKGRRRDPLA